MCVAIHNQNWIVIYHELISIMSGNRIYLMTRGIDIGDFVDFVTLSSPPKLVRHPTESEVQRGMLLLDQDETRKFVTLNRHSILRRYGQFKRIEYTNNPLQ